MLCDQMMGRGADKFSDISSPSQITAGLLMFYGLSHIIVHEKNSLILPISEILP